MKLIIFFALGLINCSQVFSQHNAGTILYFESESGVFLLLADHKNSHRGWGSFGGNNDGGEPSAKVAARETEEETRGFFKEEQIFQKIQHTAPIVDGNFAFFFVEVDFVPAIRIENNQIHTTNSTYRERHPYAWIPYSQIEQYVSSDVQAERYTIDNAYFPKNTERDWIWKELIKNLRVAREQSSIPWIK